jgi:pimeloyl-ACP methyl ester carboxylesterase
MHNESTTARGYAPINGLNLYYEISGRGDPLVYTPLALSYGSAKEFPLLSRNHSLIRVDLQGGGRTADVPERPMSLQQHAQDVVSLLDHLGIAKSDFFGESYGGAIAALIALHHPDRVGRVATYGTTFGPPEVAFNTAMLHFDAAPTPASACFDLQRKQYEAVAPQPDYWPQYWAKTVGMQWQGFSNAELAAIQAPFLIALGDRDFVRVDHALDAFRRLPNAQLAVIPDAGHFALFSEPERVTPVIEHFLQQPANRPPVGNSQAGYQPGKTR